MRSARLLFPGKWRCRLLSFLPPFLLSSPPRRLHIGIRRRIVQLFLQLRNFLNAHCGPPFLTVSRVQPHVVVEVEPKIAEFGFDPSLRVD